MGQTDAFQGFKACPPSAGSGFSPAAGLKSGRFDRERNFLVSVKKSKSQITNNKQIIMTKIPNNKPVWVIGY